jgi:hypothetical protein
MYVCRFNSGIGISEIHPKDVITLSYLFIIYCDIFVCYFDSLVTPHEHFPLLHVWTVPRYCFMGGINLTAGRVIKFPELNVDYGENG